MLAQIILCGIAAAGITHTAPALNPLDTFLALYGLVSLARDIWEA